MQLLKKLKNKENGFTLLELLLTIAIIVWMSAVLLPVLSRAREFARRAVCSGNIKQLLLAIQMYGEDNEEYLPVTLTYWANRGSYFPEGEVTHNPLINALYPKYLPNPNVFYCPSLRHRTADACLEYGETGYYYWSYSSLWAGDHPLTFAQVNRDKVIFSDYYVMGADGAYSWHETRNQSVPTKPIINAGFMDGHVNFIGITSWVPQGW